MNDGPLAPIIPIARVASQQREAFLTLDAWSGLRTVIRSRLVVAMLAIPVGVLLAPNVTPSAWWVLLVSLVTVGLLSTAYVLGVRLGRWREFQMAGQIAGDLALVTGLAVATGGRGSQFALFYGLVVVTGGLLGRYVGGVLTAGGAALGFMLLPALSKFLEIASRDSLEPSTPPGVVIAFLGVLGVLGGMLGERVHRTRTDLERTTRELDRVRVDNDTVLRHLTTGVLTVDADGVVAYLNPAAEQVLGLRSLECRGQPMSQAFPGRLEAMRELVLETLRTRVPRARAELNMSGAAGRALPVGISTNLLMHEGGLTGVVAVFQDLTEVREMERRARRNETLAEIGALSARIAHELRNGLNPISGSVECLQRELNLTGENAVLMELIGRESTRLNRFVADLLNYSRERDLAMDTVAIQEHFAELADTLQRDSRLPAKVHIQYEPIPEDVMLEADVEQLRQVWVNLAVNAFEAMPEGGRLTVRVRVADHHAVIIEFEDTGTGIASDDLPRVSQPFYTTKPGGTGLGLAIASRIVERHGGALVLESVMSRGTIARVTLPGTPAVARQAA